MTEAKYSSKHRRPRSVIDIVMPVTNDGLYRDMLGFYHDYERVHGKVNLTVRYTSTLPLAEQDWLLENDPKSYFEGLPEFAQAFIIAKMDKARSTGKLDDTPEQYLQLYLKGQLTFTRNTPRR